MKFDFCNFRVSKTSRFFPFAVLAIWFLGFFLGTFAGSFSEPSFASMMHRYSFVSVSIVGSIFVICLPFLLLIFSILIHRVSLLLLISFLKSFAFGFVSFWFLIAFGELHWFIKGFLMFSNIGCSYIFVIFLYLFMTGTVSTYTILLGMGMDIILGLVDFCIVAPALSTSVLF